MTDEPTADDGDDEHGTAEPLRGETFRVNGLQVSDEGRITIPKTRRDRYNISYQDYVHCRIRTHDDTPREFQSYDQRIDSHGKITIPARQRRRYDIEDGDGLDVVFTIPEAPGT
jgi:bifunctional DNA-binding transcriptional regulator/antitoxin component of YhaV-PrlF toxin-antitoxin module